MLVLNKKELIFYFVDKIKSRWSKEWRSKLDGVYITVEDNTNVLKKGRKTLGYYRNGSIRFPGTGKFAITYTDDIYKSLKYLERLVEHELLHAIGFNDKQIYEREQNEN